VQVVKYSADLLAELPVKFLLSAAESQQAQFEGMFPSLLRHVLRVSHVLHREKIIHQKWFY
jgi:hypothetical protein